MQRLCAIATRCMPHRIELPDYICRNQSELELERRALAMQQHCSQPTYMADYQSGTYHPAPVRWGGRVWIEVARAESCIIHAGNALDAV